MLLGVDIPRSTPDRTQFAYNLVTRAMNSGGRVAGEDSTVLTVATPRVRVRAELPNTEVKPGDTLFYRLVLVNDGGGLAKNLQVTEYLPNALEFISSSPELTIQDLPGGGRGFSWRVAGARGEAVSKGLTTTPGDTMYVPFIVRNPSNYPESFELRIVAPGAPQATVYADLNGDGRHQTGEPAVTQTAALDPRGGQYPVLLGVDIPRSTPDRTQYAYNLVTRALNAAGRIAGEDSTVLTVATPRVRVRAELPNTEARPGDTLFYRLVLVNDGGGLAKSLVVTEQLPESLEFVSSAPELTLQDLSGGGRGLVWRVAELAPGDTQVLQVTVRLRPNLAADAVITPRHTLNYQDSNANAYRGQ